MQGKNFSRVFSIRIGVCVVIVFLLTILPSASTSKVHTPTVAPAANHLVPALNSIRTGTTRKLFSTVAKPDSASPAVASLTATKTDNTSAAVNPGDTIMYTIDITNTGTMDLNNVVFNDTIDPNTTLVSGSLKVSPVAVNDTYNTIGNVNISVPAPGLLGNDLNPGGMGALAFTQINGSAFSSGAPVTTTHGSVTVNSDGSFTYNPTAGFSGPSDSFTYTLGNGTGKTDSATVTINISGLIWFVNNSPGSNGDGRLNSPFRNLVGGANPLTGTLASDNIFIYSGSGNYTGGLTLTTSEKVIGQGATQSILAITGLSAPSGTNLLPATSGANPVITGSNITAITLGTSNQLHGFTIGDTGNMGTDISGSSFGTLTVKDVTLNGTGRALNLLTGSIAAGSNFATLESNGGSPNEGVRLSAVGGSFTATTTNIVNPAGTGIDVQNSTAGASFSFGSATVNKGSSNGTGLNLNTNSGSVSFSSLAVTTSNGTGVSATSGGTVNVTTGSISSTSAPAIVVSSTTLGMTFTSVSSTTSSATGISITSATGVSAANCLSIGATTITNANQTGILVQSLLANSPVSFGNTSVTNPDAGTVGGTGVRLIDNVGNVSFGSLNITPEDNQRAFHATNAVANSGSITTAGGAITAVGATAVEINRSTAGTIPLVMSLTSVSVTGGNTGILLNQTSGSFTINGSASTAGSGGVIQSTTNRGASFINATNITLKNMNFINATTVDSGSQAECGSDLLNNDNKNCSAPIHLDTVTGVTLNNVDVNGSSNVGLNGFAVSGMTMTGIKVRNGGDNVGVGGGVLMKNLSGTVTVSNSQFMNNTKAQFEIVNVSGTLNNFTVTGSEFTGNRLDASSNAISAQGMVITNTDSVMTINIGDGTVAGSNNFHDTFSNGFQFAGDAGGGSTTLNINKNSFTNCNSGVVLQCAGIGTTSSLNYTVQNNTVVTGALSGSGGIIASGTQQHQMAGLIQGNTIGTSGVAGSGAKCGGGCSGITVNSSDISAAGGGRHDAQIIGNTIQRVDASGIFVVIGRKTSGNITITGNLIREPDNAPATTFAAVAVQGGIVAADTCCITATIGGSVTPPSYPSATANSKNRIEGVWDPSGFQSEIFAQRKGGTYNLPGLSGAADTFIAGNNDIVDNTGPKVTALGTFSNGASCSAGPIPQLTRRDDSEKKEDVLLATRERVNDGVEVRKLTPQELAWIVQAAIARWTLTDATPEDIARLQAATFEVSELPTSRLADLESTHVRVSDTGAGYGWYFDETPQEDSEFQVIVPEKELQAMDSSPAYEKMDLMTVVMHELGRIYMQGKDRLPRRTRLNLRSMLESSLPPGVRRMPLDQWKVGSVSRVEPQIIQPSNDRVAPASVALLTNDSDATQERSDNESQFSVPGTAMLRFSDSIKSATVNSSDGFSSRPAKYSATRTGYVPSSSARVSTASNSSRSTVIPQTPTITQNLGKIPVGEKVSLMFSVTVNNPVGVGATQVCNQGSVTSTEVPGPTLTDDPDTGTAGDATCTPLNVADVSVTKSAGASPVCSTSNITFGINYNNAGPAAALNAVVSDAMPAGTSLVSVTTPATWSRTDSTPVGGNGTIKFSKASSANGDSAAFTIVVSINGTVADGAVINNTASVASTTPDPNSTNNTSAQTATTVKKSPTTATVGAAQTICALGTTTALGANTPTIGAGTWTVQSGGTGTFNPNATTPGATFTHLTGTGPLVLRWTISNPPCADSFAEVSVTVKAAPTASVGGAQTICALGTTASLGGNTPSVGATGTWSIVTAGVTGTFNPNATTPGATFTHATGGVGSTITLRWTVSNAPCTDATADVLVTIKAQPTATVSGAQTICAGGTTAGLGGNTPAAGQTGAWSIVTAGVVGTFNPNATTPNATFTHTSGGSPSFVLRWTVSSPPCTAATADVTINLLPAPLATAGAAQTVCENGTTSGLGGNTPAAGETGTWSIVTAGATGTFNPNASTPNATFSPTSGPGTITVRWTVTNPTCSQSATADVTITVKQQPTATAGGAQTMCALGTTASLGGNTPSGGATGSWSIVTAGVTGTFNPNAGTPGATFTHLTGTGVITLRWTVSNPPCANATADVAITVNQPATTATVGANQTICALSSTSGLGGNTPTSGSGFWTVQSGGTGTFSPNATTPGATFTHTGGAGPIVLRWTISNPPCPSSFAELTINIVSPPTTATVGSNQVIPPGGTTGGLGGNSPSVGSGMWSIVTAGATGTFNPNAMTPNATWTHLTGSGQIVLRWMISNPPCPPSQADLTIQIGIPPTITCPSSPVVANTTPGLCSASVSFSVMTTGLPSPTVTCTPPSGSVFPKGNTTVNCTASNNVTPDATCSFTVTVNDNEPPMITCPPNLTVGTDPNLCSAVVTYTAPTVTDNCPCNVSTKKSKVAAICAPVCNPPSGSTFQKGTTTVTCSTSDLSGNQSSCSFTITVNDTQPPSIACPANIIQDTDADKCSALVSYPAPIVSDNCPNVGAPVCNPPSGSTFPKGTTTVSCTVSDGSANQSGCSFSVTVNDTQPPSIVCPANITTKTPNPGDPCVVIYYPAPTVSDNCPGVGVICTPPSGGCLPLGTTKVTCTATDTSGNVSTCTFKVVVFDLCVQDDTNPGNVVLINSVTGDYRVCCNGTTYTGRGTMTVRGLTYKLVHNPQDRRLLVNIDESVHKGTASLQAPAGTQRCSLSDRNTQDNNCACQ